MARAIPKTFFNIINDYTKKYWNKCYAEKYLQVQIALILKATLKISY